MFKENEHIAKRDSFIGTKAIYDRWIREKNINWDEDLSGPFVVGLVEKKTGRFHVVTDMMSFIPVYKYQQKNVLVLGTHADLVSRLADNKENIDLVSLADFILNGVITYPYTLYKHIFQLEPSTSLIIDNDSLKQHQYWLPVEDYSSFNIDVAAEVINTSFKEYISKIVKSSRKVGLLLSGGEDSRVVGYYLPKFTTAITLLDANNREGNIARKVADKYSFKHKVVLRSKLRYLEVLEQCSDLVGTGSQYTHGHTYGFEQQLNLTSFDSIFGGFLSDTLLKGFRIPIKWKMLNFLPQIKTRQNWDSSAFNILKRDVFKKLKKRQEAHLEKIRKFRFKSAEEWFFLWPINMHMDTPNIHFNRRLFKSYEPYITNKILKQMANVPQEWKLNRRLFHRAFKNSLIETKNIQHGDGRFPHLPWYINSLILLPITTYRLLLKYLKLQKNEGPWCDWKYLIGSSLYLNMVTKFKRGYRYISKIIKNKNVGKKSTELLSINQKVNMLQASYQIYKKNEN